MKRKIFTTTLLLCSFIICLAAIADLNGKWKGVIKMSDGNDLPLTYVFKVDGEKLNGSVISDQGELPMYEGKISGANFTFKIDVNGAPITNIGKYYGDSTIVDADLNGHKLHAKLTRAD
ncbi:MAG: glycoside hydrolase [Mucilaginibacter sp.]|jgi:hypothetical protein|nr:glycoside hydrolase [Mucilaginibacter sp.]